MNCIKAIFLNIIKPFALFKVCYKPSPIHIDHASIRVTSRDTRRLFRPKTELGGLDNDIRSKDSSEEASPIALEIDFDKIWLWPTRAIIKEIQPRSYLLLFYDQIS